MLMDLPSPGDFDGADETGYNDPENYDLEDSEAPDEAEDEGGDEDEAGDEKKKVKPLYEHVDLWVQGFFLPVVRRQIHAAAGTGLSWDERWWLYPEVVARFTALHHAWEEARASDKPSAVSLWWIQHLEPHLRVILDGQNGPMANADAEGTFAGWPSMPHQPAPPAVLQEIRAQGKK